MKVSDAVAQRKSIREFLDKSSSDEEGKRKLISLSLEIAFRSMPIWPLPPVTRITLLGLYFSKTLARMIISRITT